MTPRRLLALLSALLLAACERNPSTLFDLAGTHARLSAKLFWWFCAIDGAIWVIVLGFLFTGLARRHHEGPTEPMLPTHGQDRPLRVAVGLAIAATVLILTVFVALSYHTDRQLIAADQHPDLEIEVTGHQWWWELRYPGKTPSDTFTTANELHVPVGATVRLNLQTSDVIHSVWFPNLAGKRDIIPGHDEELVIHPDKPGVWRGRCAEFCGVQHAFMGLTLIVEPRPAFEAWEQAQRLPASDPVMLEQMRGREVFTQNACASCHAIRTRDAPGQSNFAPDLTHLKSRSTIGAGAAQNSKGDLGGWILDPHGIKPGVHMPNIQQSPQDFQALLSYLEMLK